MKLFKQIVLTIGKPWKVIIYLAIPIFLSQILGNAFSLINPSNLISDESYIGVCFSSPMAWLVSVIIMGFSAMYILNKKLKQNTIYS